MSHTRRVGTHPVPPSPNILLMPPGMTCQGIISKSFRALFLDGSEIYLYLHVAVLDGLRRRKAAALVGGLMKRQVNACQQVEKGHEPHAASNSL